VYNWLVAAYTFAALPAVSPAGFAIRKNESPRSVWTSPHGVQRTGISVDIGSGRAILY